MTVATRTLAHKWARDMVAMGCAVLPLRPKSKEPFVWKECEPRHRPLAGGTHRATKDPKTVDRWFAIEPDMNYGVACGAVSNDLVVLDADVKGKGNGLDDLKALSLPDSHAVTTPSGGMHVYFRGVRASGAKVFGDFIDVKAEGGYVVGPGCRTDNGMYASFDGFDIEQVPEHIAERLKAPKAVAANADSPPPCGEDNEEDIEAARQFLDAEAPAIQGQGGRAHTLKITRQLRDKGISAETAIDLIANSPWNARCEPPWTLDELMAEVPSWYTGCKLPAGNKSINDDFNGVMAEKPADPETVTPLAQSSLLITARSIDFEDMANSERNSLVSGLVYPGEFGVLFGASGAGKSFIAFHMAHHVARGAPWLDRPVRRAPVLVVALEGLRGAKARLMALEQTAGAAGDWLAIAAVSIPLATRQYKEGLKVLRAAIAEQTAKCGVPTGWVLIDTYSRATAGDDENSAKDAGAFVEKVAAVIQRETAAAVWVVHHSGHDGKLRGSTALRGAADVVLQVEARGQHRQLIADKVKDGEQQTLADFRIETRTVYVSPVDGKEVVSGLAVVSAPATKSPGRKWPPVVRRLLTAWAQCEIHEIHHPDTGEVGEAVQLAELREKFCDPSKSANNNSKQFGTALKTWVNGGAAERLGTERLWRRSAVNDVNERENR